MKGKKKPNRSKMSPQINSQDPLSDLPRLHVADESNMAAEMGELEICRYPGNAGQKCALIFWFLSSKGRAQNKRKLRYDEGDL